MIENVEAEQNLISSALFKPDIIHTMSGTVAPDDFNRVCHRVIYSALLEMATEQKPIDLVTFTERLRQTGKLDDIGGVGYITRLYGAAYTAANWRKYADIVLKKSQRRKLLDIAASIKADAEDEAVEVDVGIYQDRLSKTLTGAVDIIPSMRELAIPYLNWIEAREQENGIPSGLKPLDELTGRYQRGDLIIIAARPSMGKTAFALQSVLGAARAGHKTAFFSLEMSKELIITRMLASTIKMRGELLQNPAKMTDEEGQRRMEGINKLSLLPLYIVDKGVDTIDKLEAAARVTHAKNGLDMLVIDYLQLLSSGRKNDNNRVYEVAYISRRLKLLARSLNVPVIALSQLSRGVESRQDKRPMMSDLRDSGGIEQDADQIMLLYRESYYTGEDNNITEINLVKNRNGAIGGIKLMFVPEVTTFYPIMGRSG